MPFHLTSKAKLQAGHAEEELPSELPSITALAKRNRHSSMAGKNKTIAWTTHVVYVPREYNMKRSTADSCLYRTGSNCLVPPVPVTFFSFLLASSNCFVFFLPYRAAHLPFPPQSNRATMHSFLVGRDVLSRTTARLHASIAHHVFRSSLVHRPIPSICLYIPAPPPPSLGPELSLQPLFFCFLLLLKLGRPIGLCNGFVSLNP